mmetsp:Transcript_39424/g.104005  ORF Transcript_39424/g.104005 Transcript_39424/m.104005 type:complete len:328 (+) Transcript_39424:845-1828(+)
MWPQRPSSAGLPSLPADRAEATHERLHPGREAEDNRPKPIGSAVACRQPDWCDRWGTGWHRWQPWWQQLGPRQRSTCVLRHALGFRAERQMEGGPVRLRDPGPEGRRRPPAAARQPGLPGHGQVRLAAHAAEGRGRRPALDRRHGRLQAPPPGPASAAGRQQAALLAGVRQPAECTNASALRNWPLEEASCDGQGPRRRGAPGHGRHAAGDGGRRGGQPPRERPADGPRPHLPAAGAEPGLREGHAAEIDSSPLSARGSIHSGCDSKVAEGRRGPSPAGPEPGPHRDALPVAVVPGHRKAQQPGERQPRRDGFPVPREHEGVLECVA